MIAHLRGTLIEKNDQHVVLDVQNVGYELFCSSRTLEQIGQVASPCALHVFTHYRAEGASLFGFKSAQEKALFLYLIKVDSVGPKSALHILSAAPWLELVQLIEEGDVASLAKLPKISKKTAEHVVVKLKGKLGDLLGMEPASAQSQNTAARKLKIEAQTALSHLGYKFHEIDRALGDLDEKIWSDDLQTIIRHALNDLSGNL